MALGDTQESLTESRPIVVGYDASGPATVALHWAGTLAAQSQRKLIVLSAGQRSVAILDAGYSIWNPGDQLADAKDVAQTGVDELASRHPGLRVEAHGSLLNATTALDEASTSAHMVVAPGCAAQTPHPTWMGPLRSAAPAGPNSRTEV